MTKMGTDKNSIKPPSLPAPSALVRVSAFFPAEEAKRSQLLAGILLLDAASPLQSKIHTQRDWTES